MRDKDEEFKKRIKYRWEFLKRNPEAQQKKPDESGSGIIEPEMFHLRLFKPWVDRIKNETLIPEEEFTLEVRKIIVGLPSIEIIHGLGKGEMTKVRLNYLEEYENYLSLIKKWQEEYPDDFEKNGKLLLAINALDKEEKSINIKIHLDRQKDEITSDIKILLDILQMEAGFLGINLKKQRKRPRKKTGSQRETIWGTYDLYLKVWDLIEKEGKKPLEIAKELFPIEFADPSTLPDDSTDQNPESALKKVVNYHKQAKKMINGGWRQI